MSCPGFGSSLGKPKVTKTGPFVGKKQSKEAFPEGAQMLDSMDKDFKSVVLNMFRELKETISKQLKKSMRTNSHQVAHEREITKKEPNRNFGVEK